MANGDDPFSTSMSMLRDFHSIRFAAARKSVEQENPAIPPPPPREIPTASPPLRFTAPRETNLADEEKQSLINSLRSATLTPQETDTCLQSLFKLMTISEEEDGSPFKHLIPKLDGSDLQRMASLLTSNSGYYFLEIARNNNGFKRLQKLLGKSDDADNLFFAAILRHFLHLMTDKYASYVAIQGMRVFSQEKKMAMCGYILCHALELACDRHGCIALNKIITDLDHPYFRNQLLDIVAYNALRLSHDASGNFVVQHVLKLYDLRCTYNIAISLHSHCVELSFQKCGSYIVEKLLETEESMAVVVIELLECDGHTLMRLARHEFGNFVVGKALRVTQAEMTRADMFWGLVHKLMRFRRFLDKPRGSMIATMLDSVCQQTG